jgi:chorismate mutase
MLEQKCVKASHRHVLPVLGTVEEQLVSIERDENRMSSRETVCRGIRGATTVEQNNREEILAATDELLKLLIEKNDLHPDDIVSAIFSMTEDLDAEFPAVAARKLGWIETALICTREIPVPGSLKKCIRVLIHVNTTKSISEIQHVYIRRAVALRPTFKIEL